MAVLEPRQVLPARYCGAWSLALAFFMSFLLINFAGDELMQGRTLTSQQVNRTDEFRLEFVIAGAELVAWGVCFDREFEFGVSMMGKWLRIACFSYIGFSY